MKLPLIVIDAGGLDAMAPRGGQYRYVVDLIRGLAALSPPARFIFLGGDPEPIPELKEVFVPGGRWEYKWFPRPAHRGSLYLEQIRLAAILWRWRANLYHSLHTVVPIFAPCPIVTTILDLMYEIFPDYATARRSRPYRLYRWSVRNCVRRSICTSRTTTDDVCRLWGINRRLLDIVYLGITRLDSVEIRLKSKWSEYSETILVSVYNLEPRKNLHMLLSAFAEVRNHYPELRLLLYGEAGVTADRERAFLSQVIGLGIETAVVRTGRLSEELLISLYQRADIFVFPSLYEGFGYPILEAMAAGSCVIARHTSAMAEIVGSAGVLIETADRQLLTNAIIRLLTCPEERLLLGKCAAIRSREFSVTRMADLTWKTYETSLASTTH